MAASPLGNYTKKEQIGKGTFGKIFKAQKIGSETLVALKFVDLKHCKKKDKEHVQNEVELLQTCQHTNLVQFIESFSYERGMCIVMELCNGGNLRKYVEESDGLSEDSCIHVLEQICDGLKYLHDKDIAHRDVKTTNILVHRPRGEHDGELVIKIGDFGLAKVMDTLWSTANPTTCVGSPYFMSPEMINGQPYDKSTDIWSLGCVAYEMATKDVPYEAKLIDDLKDKITKDRIQSSNIPYCYEMQGLIMGMMDKDKTRRPCVQTITTFLLQHNHAQTPTDKTQSRKRDVFAQTWHPGTVHKQLPRTTGGTDSSGYDTHEETAGDGHVIVHIPVKMTEDQKDCLEMTQQLQTKLTRKLGRSDVLDQIHKAIERTKHMDSYTVFMTDMEKLLDRSTFERCKCDLGSLWTYRRELLNKNFKMAWS